MSRVWASGGGPTCTWWLQVCHTKGLSALLPSFLQGSTLMGLLAAPSALVELLVDPGRHILYTRAASSAIQVDRADLSSTQYVVPSPCRHSKSTE